MFIPTREIEMLREKRDRTMMSIRRTRLKDKFSKRRKKYLQDTNKNTNDLKIHSSINDRGKEVYFDLLQKLVEKFVREFNQGSMDTLIHAANEFNNLFINDRFDTKTLIKGTNALISKLEGHKYLLCCLESKHIDNVELQNIVTWIFINLSCEEFTQDFLRIILGSGLIQSVVEIIPLTDSSEIIKNCFWILNNLVVDCQEVRDVLFQERVIKIITDIADSLSRYKKEEQMEVFESMMRFAKSYCKVQPPQIFTTLSSLFKIAEKALDQISTPNKSLFFCLNILKIASSRCESQKEEEHLLEGNLFDNLMEIIAEERFDCEMKEISLEILANFLNIDNDDEDFMPIVERNIYKDKRNFLMILDMLKSNDPMLVENTLFFLQNFFITDPKKAWGLIRDFDIIAKISPSCITAVTTNGKLYALRSFSNIFESLEPKRLIHYFENDSEIIDLVMSQLNCHVEPTLAMIILKILGMFLESSLEFYGPNEDNLVIEYISNSSYVENLESLQNHNCDRVQKNVDKLINKFFQVDTI